MKKCHKCEIALKDIDPVWAEIGKISEVKNNLQRKGKSTCKHPSLGACNWSEKAPEEAARESL